MFSRFGLRMSTNLLCSDEYPAFEPFIKLPDRKLKDYYQVIPHPVSFNTLRKHIRGSHTKSETIGTSDFKSWDAFEEEVSSIWKNARHYNEDGSAISALADNLEVSYIASLSYLILIYNQRFSSINALPQPRRSSKSHPSKSLS